MKMITAQTPHESFSFSRRFFNWKKTVEDDEDMAEILNLDSSKSEELGFQIQHSTDSAKPPKKKLSAVAVAKLRSALALGTGRRTHFSSGPKSKLVGTLFGHRRGNVHFALQEDFKLAPRFLIELATPTSVLVKEMASGLVRVALECDKRAEKKGMKLMEEPVWRAYCNGKKCGYATRRECGPDAWEFLNAIGPISMGAGVMPGPGLAAEPDGEIMYMRAKFERVVGSKDSEAFYMVNLDGNGGPQLSIFLLRV